MANLFYIALHNSSSIAWEGRREGGREGGWVGGCVGGWVGGGV